jgi:protein-S-isoprenylcysteine O-methyltransferase Ste14
MCIFCAAIPATVAIGTNLNAKQNATRQAAEKEGIAPPAKKPIAKITLGALVLLAICSVTYHTIIARIWGLPFF